MAEREEGVYYRNAGEILVASRGVSFTAKLRLLRFHLRQKAVLHLQLQLHLYLYPPPKKTHPGGGDILTSWLHALLRMHAVISAACCMFFLFLFPTPRPSARFVENRLSRCRNVGHFSNPLSVSECWAAEISSGGDGGLLFGRGSGKWWVSPN